MKYTLGFAPCPNDTFIFDALINNKIDTGGLQFNIRLEDVETLNEMAINHTLDFTKVSYGVLPVILKDYKVLNSGSALGKGVGPLLISKKMISFDEVNNCTIAIPGENTTAHLLFSQAFPDAKNKVFKKYDTIEEFVLSSNGNALGVIIHENRFTYFERGLEKIIDLGNYWEKKSGYPIPLGGIVGKRNLEEKVLAKVDSLIKKSIEFAFKNYPLIPDYVKINSHDMREEIMKKHIDLYVNDFSVSLGDSGKDAIRKLISVSKKTNKIPADKELFVQT